MEKIIIDEILTNNSKIKINLINKTYIINDTINLITNTLQNMITSSMEEINLEMISDNKLIDIKNIFFEFEKTINNNDTSKFYNDVSKMNTVNSIKLINNSNKIIINFLSNNSENNTNLISSIIYSINIMCNLFPYKYDGLNINICLDNNKRDLKLINKNNLKKQFEYLNKYSLSFNVSGVTYRKNKIINLTKKEEIIKLLFQEMIHFIGFDKNLINVDFSVKWNIKNKKINLSEAYTEFLAVILHFMYISIHIMALNKIDPVKIFKQILSLEIEYSLFLCASVLKFYGYDELTYHNFFVTDNNQNWSPICTWEYIFIRTKLLLNLNKLSKLNSWNIDTNNTKIIIDIIKNDDDLIQKLKNYMSNFDIPENISYLCIDFDWSKV
jgi:hypothetical protein